MNKFSLILAIVAAAFMLYSCNGDPSGNDVDPVDTLVDVDATLDDVEIAQGVTFKLPSPVELYLFLWEEDAKFNKESMNSIENVNKYFTTPQKALNFGVYASDLAYCTVFGQAQETFTYFTTVKQIADEMGLTEGFDAEVAKKLEENINNKDSLYQITTSSYADATNFLENQEEGNLLPFILTGAWLESIHISIGTVDKFSENNEIVIRIAEQQFLLENLLDYLKGIERNADLNDLNNKLIELRSSFDKLYDNTDVIITEAQYKEITEKVEKLRTEITS